MTGVPALVEKPESSGLVVGGGCWNGFMFEAGRRGTAIRWTASTRSGCWTLPGMQRDGVLMERAKPRSRTGGSTSTPPPPRAAWRCGNAGALDCEVPIGGPGTLAMAAFTAEPFGAALGISTISAMNLISVAVELKTGCRRRVGAVGGPGRGGVEAEDGRAPHQCACRSRPPRTSTQSWRRSWPPAEGRRSSEVVA